MHWVVFWWYRWRGACVSVLLMLLWSDAIRVKFDGWWKPGSRLWYHVSYRIRDARFVSGLSLVNLVSGYLTSVYMRQIWAIEHGAAFEQLGLAYIGTRPDVSNGASAVWSRFLCLCFFSLFEINCWLVSLMAYLLMFLIVMEAKFYCICEIHLVSWCTYCRFMSVQSTFLFVPFLLLCRVYFNIPIAWCSMAWAISRSVTTLHSGHNSSFADWWSKVYWGPLVFHWLAVTIFHFIIFWSASRSRLHSSHCPQFMLIDSLLVVCGVKLVVCGV